MFGAKLGANKGDVNILVRKIKLSLYGLNSAQVKSTLEKSITVFTK